MARSLVTLVGIQQILVAHLYWQLAISMRKLTARSQVSHERGDFVGLCRCARRLSLERRKLLRSFLERVCFFHGSSSNSCSIVPHCQSLVLSSSFTVTRSVKTSFVNRHLISTASTESSDNILCSSFCTCHLSVEKQHRSFITVLHSSSSCFSNHTCHFRQNHPSASSAFIPSVRVFRLLKLLSSCCTVHPHPFHVQAQPTAIVTLFSRDIPVHSHESLMLHLLSLHINTLS